MKIWTNLQIAILTLSKFPKFQCSVYAMPIKMPKLPFLINEAPLNISKNQLAKTL